MSLKFDAFQFWFDLQDFDVLSQLVQRKVVNEMSLTDNLQLIVCRNVAVTSRGTKRNDLSSAASPRHIDAAHVTFRNI
jgi:hypothetical protein